MVLEHQSITELSAHELANLAIPVNLALAANVLSDGAIAAAAAQQQTPIDQGI
jgi:hypothetical protein